MPVYLHVLEGVGHSCLGLRLRLLVEQCEQRCRQHIRLEGAFDTFHCPSFHWLGVASQQDSGESSYEHTTWSNAVDLVIFVQHFASYKRERELVEGQDIACRLVVRWDLIVVDRR